MLYNLKEIKENTILFINKLLSIRHIVFTKIKYYLYFVLSINVFRFIVGYTNKIESQSMEKIGCLYILNIYNKIGAMVKSTTMSMAEMYNSKQYMKLDKNKYQNKDIANIVSKDIYINSLICIFVFILSAIFTLLVTKVFIVIDFIYILLIYLNIAGKLIHVHASVFRNCIETYSRSPLNIIIPTIAVLSPFIIYKYIDNLTLSKICIICFLIMCFVVVINFFACQFILKEKIVIKKFSNIYKDIQERISILPGILISNTSNFAFVELISFLCMFYIREDIMTNIVSYNVLRQIISIHNIPITKSIRISASHTNSINDWFLSSILVNLLIGGLYIMLLPCIIKSGFITKIFYTRKDITNFSYLMTIIALCIYCVCKPIEMFIMMYSSKLYSFSLILVEVLTVVLYNVLCCIKNVGYDFETIPAIVCIKSAISLFIYIYIFHDQCNSRVSKSNIMFFYIANIICMSLYSLYAYLFLNL